MGFTRPGGAIKITVVFVVEEIGLLNLFQKGLKTQVDP